MAEHGGGNGRPAEPGRWEAAAGDAGSMFYAYGSEGPDPAISAACMEQIVPIERARADGIGVSQFGPGRTPPVRDGMTRGDYEFYRPAEAVPRRQKEIIAACDESYQRVGILRNIIDLMSDFASQGIEIFHPNKTKQSRYRHWFRKVGGKERSERFVNLLYRHGNVVVRRAFADLNAGDMVDLERGIAGRTPEEPEDMEYQRGPKIFRNRIPLQYSFLNPTAIDIVGGDLALFAGQPRYALRLPEVLIRTIKNPKTDDERRLVKALPEYIVGPIRANKKSIPLDPTKVDVYHYKKDDWQQWAHPMTYSILADLKMYEKAKLADMSALDGAISHIRLWRLGLPEYKIQPGPKAFSLLRDQLRMAGGGGSLDLMWDATLDFKETSPDIANFLGLKKYEPVLHAIYAGLGIPQAMAPNKEGGMTSSALSLKTLIERLQYGRDLLKKFWENELNILQEAFGDRNPAQVHFENMSLSDEANEKMLWLQLVDRDIVSVETLREKFGTIPAIEDSRIRREYAERGDDDMPEKSGPFNEPIPNPEAAAQKAMQAGLVAPSQTGAKIKPKKAGDKTLLDHQKEMQQDQIAVDKERMKHEQKMTERDQKVKEQQGEEIHQQRLQHKDAEHEAMLPIKKQAMRQKIKAKGRPGQGRPRNAKDQVRRKQRTPRATAAFGANHLRSKAAYRSISRALTPMFLERFGKASLRGMTAAQAGEFEDAKFRVLCSIGPDDDIEAVLAGISLDHLPAPDGEIEGLVRGWMEKDEEDNWNFRDIRELQTIAHATANTDWGNDGETDVDA